MLTAALFSHSPHLCGAERMLLNLALLLERSKGFHPVLLVPGEGELLAEARRHGLAFEIVPAPPWYLVPPDDMGEYRRGVARCYDALRQVFADLGADVAVINTLTTVPAVLAAVTLDIPSLLWVHGVIDSLLLPQRSSEFSAPHDELLLRCATRVVTLSNFTGEFCKKMMLRDRLDVIHNWTPVDPHFIPPADKCRLRRFSCLNTFDSHKGHATLLKAASLLKAKRPDFELHLYGDGHVRRAMESRVQSMGLKNHVRFLGRTANVDEVYDASLCVVNPADIEPFGLTLIEAMARNTPVIATRSGGPVDIVVDGECGFLVDRGDAASMADRMQALLDSPRLAERLGRGGRARARSQFSEEAAIAIFLPVIERTVEEFRGCDPAVKALANIYFTQAIQQVETEMQAKQSEIESLQTDNSRLRSIVDSAERWQQSWIRRVFRRWHPHADKTRQTGFLPRMARSVRKRREWLVRKTLGGFAEMRALKHFLSSGRNQGLRITPIYDPRHDEKARQLIVGTLAARTSPVVLQIAHSRGGGTERHLQDLARQVGSRATFVFLSPHRDGTVSLTMHHPQAGLRFEPASQFHELAGFLEECQVKRVHIHHHLGNEHYLSDLIRRLGKPFDFTVHDYYTLAPNPFLVGLDGRFVGEDLVASADKLLAAAMVGEHFPNRSGALGSLSAWQAVNRWLLADADRVIIPSQDAARRFRSHCPELKPVVSAYPETHRPPPDIFLEPIDSATPLRIAVLGEMAAHKGADVLIECARLAQSHGNPLAFDLIGNPAQYAAHLHGAGVWTSGIYQNEDVQRLIAARRPHLIWYPSLCPETYSYTLSEGVVAGRPLIVPNLGAFPERVAGRPWVWVCEWDSDPAERVAFFLKIRESNFLTKAQPERPAGPPPVTNAFYDEDYLSESPA